ncbi:AaceriAAR158Wp [[Ashbya] aceris (nom. inval.)]|nr:AaceriAAR158Wp [[Ashbya] aceris (nom. inval.)]
MIPGREVIVIEDEERQAGTSGGGAKRALDSGGMEADGMKKQKSIPNIANELAKNRAEVRAPISSINKTLVQPVARPRMHAIPLSSLLSPSVDYGYPRLSPSPQFPALSPTVVPKLETPVEQVLSAPQVPAVQLPALDGSAIGSGGRTGAAPAAAEAAGGIAPGQLEPAVPSAPARKSAPRKKKADGSGAAAKKKSEGSKTAAKKASSKPVKKEEPAAVPSDASTAGAGSGKVVLPSQEGGQVTESPLPSDGNIDDQGTTPVRTSPPANKANKSLKRTQSNLSSAQKGGSQESQKARKSLSASNLGNGAANSASPPPATGTSAAPASKKASGTSGTKKESKSKSKSAASKKKETTAASTAAADTSAAPAIALHTPKVLAPAQPIKSPSVMDVLDQKFPGTQTTEDDDPVIVVDVPLYQVDTNDYLDENGQVVFNFYNLVHEKFNTQQTAQSRAGSSAAKDRIEQGDDIAMADDDDDDDDDEEDDDDPSATGAVGASPSKSKKKSNPMKGKSRVGKYDIEDPFIDDSELLWEEQRAATKDGFFVYFGPLIQKGQYATFERVDGTMKKGGVRNPR